MPRSTKQGEKGGAGSGIDAACTQNVRCVRGGCDKDGTKWCGGCKQVGVKGVAFLCLHKDEIIPWNVWFVMHVQPCTAPTSSIMASVSSTVIVAATPTASVSTIFIVVFSFCRRDCCLYPSQL
jgi:hypothetical protein